MPSPFAKLRNRMSRGPSEEPPRLPPLDIGDSPPLGTSTGAAGGTETARARAVSGTSGGSGTTSAVNGGAGTAPGSTGVGSTFMASNADSANTPSGPAGSSAPGSTIKDPQSHRALTAERDAPLTPSKPATANASNSPLPHMPDFAGASPSANTQGGAPATPPKDHGVPVSPTVPPKDKAHLERQSSNAQASANENVLEKTSDPQVPGAPQDPNRNRLAPSISPVKNPLKATSSTRSRRSLSGAASNAPPAAASLSTRRVSVSGTPQTSIPAQRMVDTADAPGGGNDDPNGPTVVPAGADNGNTSQVPVGSEAEQRQSVDGGLTASPETIPKRRPSPMPEFPELPEAPAPRVFGHGWNAAHKVPNIQQYTDMQKQHEAEAEEYARIVEARRQAAEENGDLSGRSSQDSGEHARKKAQPQEAPNEKQRLMDQMNSAAEKPTERYRKAGKGQRRVRDPITGSYIIVKDIDDKDFDAHLPRYKGGNVLYYNFPPPAPSSIQAFFGRIHQLQYAIAGGMLALWFFTAFGSGFYRFFWRSSLIVALTIGLFSLCGLLERNIEKEIEAIRLDLGRARGEAFSPPYPESTEWLNGLVKLVWGLIDPAVFVPMADMVEDILQQSLPGFVDAVRITDVGQGSNPLRIMSIRALPDQPGDVGYPRKGWIDRGEDLPLKDTGGKDIDEDQAGDYYNFEVAFSYTALPGQGMARAKNIHMLIEFFLGAYDWFHIPIPIWIQVERIFGVVRLRCQFIPEPPFIRNVTFALCGVPAVDVSAIPMSRHLPNVLDLPFISGFVKSGIAAGTAELCVPKSMTINLKDILSGTAVGDTRAVGVFVITVHYCEGLSAQDNNGKSDPYIVMAYAKYGRPLYSTRIIIEDLNPVYEETAVLMLTEDEIKGKEDLAMMLWDSDKFSADDLVGRVQIPVEELMEHKNVTIKREDSLKGFEDDNEMPGKLVWSIGYYEKAQLVKDLERPMTEDEQKAAPPPQSPPSKEMLPYDAAPNPARNDLPPPPPDVNRTRPNPDYPSGVLSIVLHQINNLERQQLEGKSGEDREGEAGQDTDDPSQQTSNLPSGYGEFIINDELIYRTRVKQYTTNPYFEAGTEVFIRDFETTEVRIVVRDSRLRESDPIMGIITVHLAELFKESSTSTMTYPLQGGVGFGKANVSFAFRGMQLSLPPNMRGWDTGTLIVSNVRLTPAANSKIPLKEMSLRVVTHESTEVMKRKEAAVEGDTIVWGDDDDLFLPIYSRYQSSVVLEFGATGLGKMVGKGKPSAIAVLWLQDLTDNIEGDVELPVIAGENWANLKQNVINDQTLKHHEFEVVGTVHVNMLFSAGLDLEHDRLRLSQSRRHAFEAYMAVEGEGEVARRQAHFADDGVIDRDEKREMNRAHRRALESRGRGMAQVGVYRSVKWMGRGLKDRLPGRKKTREPTVQTEA